MFTRRPVCCVRQNNGDRDAINDGDGGGRDAGGPVCGVSGVPVSGVNCGVGVHGDDGIHDGGRHLRGGHGRGGVVTRGDGSRNGLVRVVAGGGDGGRADGLVGSGEETGGSAARAAVWLDTIDGTGRALNQ